MGGLARSRWRRAKRDSPVRATMPSLNAPPRTAVAEEKNPKEQRLYCDP